MKNVRVEFQFEQYKAKTGEGSIGKKTLEKIKKTNCGGTETTRIAEKRQGFNTHI